MSEIDDFPSGWVNSKLKNISMKLTDGSHNPPAAKEFGMPMLSAKNIERDFINWSASYRYISENDFEIENRRTSIEPNDILLTIVGTIGRCCIVSQEQPRFALQRSVAVIKPLINSKFVCYQLQSEKAQSYLSNNAKGTAQKGIYLKTLGDLDISIAPEKEQIRIVEKLEELLSDLDNGVAELKAAQIKLTHYRQSLFKSAVDGTLTQEWREANEHKITETGEQLLARILKERRARWEQQKLEEFASKKQTPPKDWQKKYPEPVKPDTSDLPELPEGWIWASVDQLAQIGTGVTPLKSRSDFYHNGTIPWVTSGAVNDEIVTQSGTLVTMKAIDECRLKMYPIGTLLVAMYGEGKTRGKCSELGIVATINQALAALVLEGASFQIKDFLKIFLLDSYQRMRAKASGGVQPNLNLLIVRSMCVPLPPLEEQSEICMLVAQQRNDIDSQKKAVDFGLQATEAQRKNLLKDAFFGKLVPQDPGDEPASVLLEKIKAERLVQAKQPKQTKKKEPSMNKLDAIAVKKWVSQQAEAFTFEQLQSAFKGDYEALKETVFEILQEEPAVIKQVFNEQRQYMMFEKATK